MKIPYVSSEWKELFKPHESGNYINDHTLFKAHDGNWHLFGISSFLGGAPNERWFAHGVTPSLDTPMTEMRSVQVSLQVMVRAVVCSSLPEQSVISTGDFIPAIPLVARKPVMHALLIREHQRH